MKIKDLVEGLRDPKDNPCWKGYHPVGTKKKGGRTVPNCVPNANEAANAAQQAAIAIAMKKAGKKPKSEAVETGKISSLQPGVAAEVDHGDGTKTTIDLKKNPSALTKDAQGKLVLQKKTQGNLAGGTTDSDENKPKVGDEVQVAAQESIEDIKRLSGLK